MVGPCGGCGVGKRWLRGCGVGRGGGGGVGKRGVRGCDSPLSGLSGYLLGCQTLMLLGAASSSQCLPVQ